MTRNINLFATSLMGSMPRSKDVLKALRSRSKGRISNEDFQKLIELETKKVVEFQEKLGLDIIVSGELGRDNYVSFVADKIGGVQMMSMAEILDYVEDKKAFEQILTILDVSASSIKNAICVAPLEYRGDIVTEELLLLKKLTDRPLKITLPGPYLLTRSMWLAGVSSKVYHNKEELGDVVVDILKKEIRQLQEIGVSVIQFDEPVLTEVVFTEGKPRTFMCAALSERKDPTEELKFASSLLEPVLASIDRSKSVASLHVCRGNWSKDESILLSGSYSPLLELFAKVNPELLSLEYSTPRAGELSSLFANETIRGNTYLGLGVLNPRSDSIETISSIIDRSLEALKFIPKERLWLNPDCGFATFANSPVNIMQTIELKVRNMVSAAKELRFKYE